MSSSVLIMCNNEFEVDRIEGRRFVVTDKKSFG